MIEAFPTTLDASVCTLARNADAAALKRDWASAQVNPELADLGYAKIHHEGPQCWITNRQGLTMAHGRYVSVNQVLAFILRKFW